MMCGPHERSTCAPRPVCCGYTCALSRYMAPRLVMVAVAFMLASTTAQMRWKKKKPRTYMHGIEDPHQGHTQGDGELYPGHKHHEQHDQLHHEPTPRLLRRLRLAAAAAARAPARARDGHSL